MKYPLGPIIYYEGISTRAVPVSSTRVAEMTKLLENVYRCVNIAIVKLKLLSLRMGVDRSAGNGGVQHSLGRNWRMSSEVAGTYYSISGTSSASLRSSAPHCEQRPRRQDASVLLRTGAPVAGVYPDPHSTRGCTSRGPSLRPLLTIAIRNDFEAD